MSTPVKLAIGCILLLLCGVVCFFIASATGLAGLSKVANEIDTQIDKSKSDEENKFNNPHKINEKVTVDKVEWTLLEAKDMGKTLKAKDKFYNDCAAESGKYVYVKFKIKNNDKDISSISNVDLLDSDKNEYKTSSDVYSCIEDDIFILENINPGLEKTFVGVYEVPSNAKDFRLKVGDLNFFTNNYSYISLGF